jgi:hypothetical protein
MRRSTVWTETDSVINPKLLNWASLELGQTSGTAPDAWVALISTWTRWQGDLEVKNFERWLYQRDSAGYYTKPALRQDHSYNASGNDMLDSSKWYVDLARTGNAIGLAIDDRFLGDGPNEVAIKVTYFDADKNPWTLEYSKPDGSTGSRRVQGEGSGKVRTATFFLSDLMATRKGTDFDFRLKSDSGTTPFMFVRLVRLNGSSVPTAPKPPDSLSVE